MVNYRLGPNGCILTVLNLFTCKFEQVLNILRFRNLNKHIFTLVDYPGQIEIFLWSASGNVILHGLCKYFTTFCIYVVDSARIRNTTTLI